MKKIIVRISGTNPYGKTSPIVGTNIVIEGRVYDTETGKYESDWAVLPVRKVEFSADATSFAEAILTTPIGQMENIEMALDHVEYENITVDRKLVPTGPVELPNLGPAAPTVQGFA